MICPCPLVAFLGGAIGSKIGISPPTTNKGRWMSLGGTATLVSLTALALKKIFNMTLCNGASLTAKTVAIVMVKALILGTIYSIAVNYLISKYVEQPVQPNRPCCRHVVVHP